MVGRWIMSGGVWLRLSMVSCSTRERKREIECSKREWMGVVYCVTDRNDLGFIHCTILCHDTIDQTCGNNQQISLPLAI